MALEPLDNVDQLVPDDVDPPSVADQANDFTNDDLFEAEPLVVEQVDLASIGKSWAFDFVSSQFKPGPGGGPQATRGLTTLRYWVEKALRTERGAYPIYHEDYGLEGVDSLVGLQVNTPEFASLPTRVQTCLLFHPHITSVEDFAVEVDPDDETIFVSFRVVTNEDEDLPFTDFALT